MTNDVVDHPRHYTSHPSKIEAIEVCRHLDFSIGNAVKYLFRVGKKDDAVQDLQKASWYLRHATEHQIYRMSPVDALPRALDVIAAEPKGSVLRDVLEYVVVHACSNPPRVADALARVEREIAERSR